jgi:hypothetical protein
MKRFLFICPLFALGVLGAIAPRSCAQDSAESLDHYRLLPQLSTLHQTGGFAGFDLSYRLLGKYDFRHGAGWTAKASFENAEIWGSIISNGPAPAYVIDVDQILNLEGLKGEALPVASPFDVFKFTGETSDGSSVDLFAAVIGPWMYLHGGTRPPANSADFFSYELRAVARSRPFADFNGDGVVDAADYTTLRDAGQMAGAGAGGSDVTAGAGYAEWKAQFGEVVPDFTGLDAMMSAAAGGAGSGGSAVPEPASMFIAISSGLLVAWRWRHRAIIAA